MENLLIANTTGSLGLSQGGLYLLWSGITVYLLAMLGIGWWSSRKVNGMTDFLVAGRRLPFWMSTATLLATWFGAGSSMGVAATVFQDGIIGVLADPFGASISLLLAGFFVVGLLRKKNLLTVTDVIEQKYGKWAGIYASAWMIPVYIGWLGAQLLGMGTILNLLTGISVLKGTLIGAAVVLIYTCAGGMWAVTLTDVVQVGLIIVGLLLIVPGALSECGGVAALWDKIPAKDISLVPESFGSSNDVVYYIGSWIIMGLGCMVGQDLVQRSLSSHTEKIAATSSILSGILYALIGLIPITIGFAARIVLPRYGISTEAMDGDLENQVLPRMAVIVLGQMHPILLTLFLAALISAIMSSADSSLLAGSSLFCNNVIAAIWPKIRERNLLVCTRITTVLLTITGLFLALKVESIYKLMINSWASQLVIVFFPVLTALYVPKSSTRSCWAAMGTATAVWIGYAVFRSWGCGMAFVPLMNSDLFDNALTCGAVYGFVAGIIAFLLSHIQERLSGARAK